MVFNLCKLQFLHMVRNSFQILLIISPFSFCIPNFFFILTLSQFHNHVHIIANIDNLEYYLQRRFMLDTPVSIKVDANELIN